MVKSLMHPDLWLLAATAQAYRCGDIKQHLYSLAHYQSHIICPITAADVQVCLSLLGLDSYRLVVPGLAVPDIIDSALERGHIVLAQVRGHPLRKRDYWCALSCCVYGEWFGITVDTPGVSVGIASHMGHVLTGFYVAVAEVLPDWELPMSSVSEN